MHYATLIRIHRLNGKIYFALYLIIAYSIDWVRQNWVFILFFIIFIEMHLFGGGCTPFEGFILGLIESFLYGVYIGLVFVPVYNFLNRKWCKNEI